MKKEVFILSLFLLVIITIAGCQREEDIVGYKYIEATSHDVGGVGGPNGGAQPPSEPLPSKPSKPSEEVVSDSSSSKEIKEPIIRLPGDVVQKLVTPESTETETQTRKKQEIIQIINEQIIIPKELIPVTYEGLISKDPFNIETELGKEFSNIIYSEITEIVEIEELQIETAEPDEIKAEHKEDHIEVQVSDNIFIDLSLEKQEGLQKETRPIPKISIAISLLP